MRKIAIALLLVGIFIQGTAFAQLEQVKIGLCLSNQFISRWSKEKEIMKNYLAARGGDLIVTDARDNAENQMKQARELMTMGIKVLIIVPVDSRSTSVLVDEAKAKGIKVICYDRLILNSPVDFYLTISSEKIGQLMAQHMLDVKPRGNYVLLNGPKEDFNTILIRKGVYDVLNDEIGKSSVKVVKDDFLSEWSEVSAHFEFKEFLNKHKDLLDGVMAGNDEIAMGVLKALKEKQLKGVKIIGQDADLRVCHLILKGDISATVWQDFEELARQAAEVALALALNNKISIATVKTRNGKYNIPSILLNPVLVNKDNVDEVLIESGFYTREEVYGEQ